MAKIVAYCWASGLIEFGETCPDNALVLATGEEEELRPIIEVLAVHSRDSDDLLIPKTFAWIQALEDDAPNVQTYALDAVITFKDRIRKARAGKREAQK
jgi:hypothetical protein